MSMPEYLLPLGIIESGHLGKQRWSLINVGGPAASVLGHSQGP